MGKKERNTTVDMLRGLAMLLVVLCHTMTGTTVHSEDSFLFNIIWSLQMPLFILISGYVTRYSSGASSAKALLHVIWKRTIAYLLPWCTWSFLIRGIIWGQSQFLDIKWLLWHMDSGYWFLATIWVISIVFAVSSFLAGKFVKGRKLIAGIVGTGMFYVLGMVILLVIGKIAGMSFLGIKLTVYYMPFFFLGYLFGQLQDAINGWSSGKKSVEFAVAVSLGVWLLILKRVSLFYIEDGGMGILIRVIASLTGCCAVCGLLCKKNIENSKRGGGYSGGSEFTLWKSTPAIICC